MSRQLHRLLLATTVAIAIAVTGAVSALAGELPVPVNGGVPKNPLPGDHYDFLPVQSVPADPVGPTVAALPWQYFAPAVVVAVAVLLLAMRAHHLHTSQHMHVHLPFRRA